MKLYNRKTGKITGIALAIIMFVLLLIKFIMSKSS